MNVSPGAGMRGQTGEHWTDLLRQDLHRIARLMKADAGEEMVVGERREVAVLFLDLHGFTALSEKLDHELVARIVHQVMMALARVVDGHGGYVDKFEGDLLMALFGAQHSGEDDAARAVACGLRLQATLREINSLLEFRGLELQARVGINVGWVTVAPDPSGHLTAFGDVVNVAARMESTAIISSVQVTEGVVSRCGDLFATQDLGEISVHGRREPVRAHRVLGPGPGLQGRWERAARVSRSALVGRDLELERLNQGWKLYLEGRAGSDAHSLWFHVEGEAGMGKSRLIHEFLSSLVRSWEAPLILRGYARSFAQPALAPWLGALRHMLGDTPAARREASQLKPRLLTLLRRTCPADDPLPAGTDTLLEDLADLLSTEGNTTDVVLRSGISPQRLICLFVLALARGGRPLLVVLEDLHWIDSGSVEVLQGVLAEPEAPSLFVLSTGRNRESHTPDVELPTLSREEVRLHGLEEVACHHLLRKMLGGEVSNEVDDFILEQSQGNPLYLEEQILDLVESGSLVEREGRWTFIRPPNPEHVPLHISSLIRSRIDRLDGSLIQALQRAAVVGMDVPLPVFETLESRLGQPTNAEEVLTALERRGFLAREVDSLRPMWRFRHVVVRNAAYEMLLLVNREVLHRRVAEALEEHLADLDDPSPGTVAHHWLVAGEGDKFEVWARRALDFAARHYQHDEVARWADLLIQRGMKGVRTLHRDRDLVSLGLRRVEALRTRQANAERRQLVDELLALCDSPTLLRERGQVLSHRARMLQDLGQLPVALASYQEALAIHQEVQDRDFLPVTLFQMGTVVSELGHSEEARVWYERSREASRQVHNRWMEGVALHNICLNAYQRGDMALGRETIAEVLGIHREVGNRIFESYALGMLAFDAVELGQLSEAYTHLDRAGRLMEQTGNLGQLMMAKSWLALVYRGMSQLEKARDLLEKSLNLYTHLTPPPQIAITRVSLASVLGELGETERANSLLQDPLVVKIHSMVPRLRANWLSVRALVLVFSSRQDDELVLAQVRAQALSWMTEAVDLITQVKLGRNLAFAWDILRLRQLLLQEGIPPDEMAWPADWSEDLPGFLGASRHTA